MSDENAKPRDPSAPESAAPSPAPVPPKLTAEEEAFLAERKAREEEEDKRRADLLAKSGGSWNMIWVGAGLVFILAIAYAMSPHPEQNPATGTTTPATTTSTPATTAPTATQTSAPY